MPLPPKSVNSLEDLKELQTWFSDVITRDLRNNSINPYGIIMTSIKEESRPIITSTPALKSYERMEIYNQQYWYRLLTIMQDEFPILRHLMGIEEFNSLVENYLGEFPSESHFLNELHDNFISYIESHFNFETDSMLLEAASYDYALSKSFEAKEESPLDPQKLTEAEQLTLPETELKLQNHTYIFKLNYDFEAYRDLVEDDEEEIIFPDLNEKKHFVFIYRENNVVMQDVVSTTQFKLLELFKNGSSINDALSKLEHHFSENDLDHLQGWFSEWISKRLFCSISE